MRNRKTEKQKNLKTKRIFLFFCFSVFWLESFSLVHSEEVSRIIAKVNNEVITSKDLDDYCKIISYRNFNNKVSCDDEKFKRELLEKLIENKLILDEAKKKDFKIPPYLVEDKFKEMASAYNSREEFEKSLVEKGLNVNLLKNKIKEQYLLRETIEKFVSSQINISPQEISAYYKNNLLQFISPSKFVLWIAKSSNKNILDKINTLIIEKGIEIAKEEYSQYLARLESPAEKLKEDILVVLEEMEEGDSVVKPIDEHFYLIYLEKITPPLKISLEEARDRIYSFLWEKKFKEKLKNWIGDLKKEAVIEYKLD